MNYLDILKKIHLVKSKKLTFKDRVLLVILAIGIFLLIIFIFYVVVFSYSQKTIANFLPAEQTVAYLEFEDFSFQPKLQDDIVFNKEQFQQTLKSAFNIKEEADITSWARDRFGIALIKSDNSENTPVLFVQTGNRHKALNFFKELTLPDEELEKSDNSNSAIYSYSQGQSFNFTFIGPYVLIAKTPKPLETIQQIYLDNSAVLKSQTDYQKSFGNLPRQSWIRGYIDFQSLHTDNIAINNIIEPLKHVINHFALTIRKNPNGFHFNVFANLNKDLLSLNEDYGKKTRFAYKLTDYISSKDLALYIGGADLSQEWQNTLLTISNLNPAYGIILESIIRAQVTNVFGNEVSLRNDFYPLFEGEYALAISVKEDSLLDVSLILSSTDQDFAEVKLSKMMKGFKYLAAKFAPKLHTVTLPDGTISRELIADTSRTEETAEIYEGYDVHCIDVTNSSSGFCYTVTDELIIMTNNRSTAINTIDLTLSPEFTLSQHQPFRQTVSNLSRVSDEMTFIDIQKALPLASNHPYELLIKQFLEKLDAVSWVKHYFDDGVSTEGYLLIK